MTRPLTEHELARLFHEQLPPAEMPGDLATRLEARVLAEVNRLNQAGEQHTEKLTPQPIAKPPIRSSNPTPVLTQASSVDVAWYRRLRNWPTLLGRTGSLTLAGSAIAILLLLTMMMPRILAPTNGDAVTTGQGDEMILASTVPPATGVAQLDVRQGTAAISRGAGGSAETLIAPDQALLMTGDRVDVQSGRSEITFSSNASAEVLPGARLRVLALPAEGTAAHITLFQEAGTSRHSVASPVDSRGRYEVRTPAARILAATADFEVELPYINGASVRVTSGSASVETASAQSIATAGETLRAQDDGTLVTDTTLPVEQSAVAAALSEPSSQPTAPQTAAPEVASGMGTRAAETDGTEVVAEVVTALLPTPTREPSSDALGSGIDPLREQTTSTTAGNQIMSPTRTPTPARAAAIVIPTQAAVVEAATPTATDRPAQHPTTSASPTRRATPTATPNSTQMLQATATVRPTRPTAPPAQPTVATPQTVNQPPTAIEDAGFTQINVPIEIPVLSNDYDVNQDTLVVIGLSQPGNGSTSNLGNGVILYTPASDYSGRDRFTYRISDGQQTATGVAYVTVQPANQPPVINPLADRSLREDSSLNVPLIVGDVDQGPEPLSLSVTSTNAQLFDEAGLQLTGSGESRSLTLSPLPNRFGEAMISVTVADGEAESSATFLVNVEPVNDAPVLASVDPLQLREDQPGTVVFGVDDVENAPDEVIVTVESSNAQLFPTDALQLTGAGDTRTLTLKPAPEASGTAQITLVASDGDERATHTFGVQVSAVDDPPTIEPVADQMLAEDSTGTLAIRVADVDSSIDTLTLRANAENLALLPNDALQVSGSGAERTLRIAPAADAFGSTPITLLASDGTSQAEKTFVLTVTPVNDPPQIRLPAEQTVEEDQTLDVPISLADADLNLDDLTLTARSDNLTLVGDAGLRISGSGGERVLSITPEAEQSGSTRITVSVNDGEAQAEASFMLTVTSVNDPPRLDAPAEVTLGEDSSTEVTIRVGDPDHSASELQVSVQGGDAALLAEGVVELNGDGNERTLRITPSPEQAGETELTLIASDGALQIEQRLRVIVEAVNDPPTIATIEDQTMSAGATRELSVNIADPDHDPTVLQVRVEVANPELISASDLTILGNNETRTLLISPKSAQNSATKVTLTVSDGEASSATSFTLIVTP